ncbi:MAG: hypothetical protein ACYC3W_03680, partial [Candidatus Nanopelagicales bacterium]
NEQRAVSRLIDRFPSVGDLRKAKTEDIADCIQVAGMPQQKAARIRGCLDELAKLDDGLAEIATWCTKDARDYLLALPGIGPKAADCILTIGLGHASMVVDVNVFKTTTALFDLKWDRAASYTQARQVSQVKELLDNAVGDDVFLCQIVHTLFLLEGRQSKLHDPGRCHLGQYCLLCECRPDNNCC